MEGGGGGGILIIDFSHNETMHSFESIHTGFPFSILLGGVKGVRQNKVRQVGKGMI